MFNSKYSKSFLLQFVKFLEYFFYILSHNFIDKMNSFKICLLQGIIIYHIYSQTLIVKIWKALMLWNALKNTISCSILSFWTKFLCSSLEINTFHLSYIFKQFFGLEKETLTYFTLMLTILRHYLDNNINIPRNHKFCWFLSSFQASQMSYVYLLL